MTADLPRELDLLLGPATAPERDAAWSTLLERWSRLILKAAARFGGDHDARMDRYRLIIEELRKDDYRRLRAYQATGQSSFAAWLTVVARRIALDHERSRYGRGGRQKTASSESRDERAARRRLVLLLGNSVDLEALPHTEPGADRRLSESQLHRALEDLLDGLDTRDRLLLRLRFEDDVSVREIAELMGFPSVFHVYHRLKTVLERARQDLRVRGFDSAAP